MPVLAVEQFQGMNARIAADKLPVVLFPKIVNLEATPVDGQLRTRPGYKSIITSGLTSLTDMTEFVDKNGTRQILLLDGTTLKESVYSGGYGAVGSLSNVGLQGGYTFDSAKFVNRYSVVRGGAGVGGINRYPFWYGYIPERNRYNSGTTISAGKYLTDQAILRSSDFINLAGTTFLAGSGAGVSGGTGYVSSAGLATGVYVVYIVAVIDGFQQFFPHAAGVFKNTAADGFVTLTLAPDSNSAHPRVTHFDVFIASISESIYHGIQGVGFSELLKHPAYFLERIDLNDDSDYITEVAGDVNNTTSNKIVINSYASWLSFDPTNMFVTNVEGAETYKITAVAVDTPTAGKVELTITPNPSDSNASRTLRFFSRWGSSKYVTFYDGNYKSLGAEMFDDIGIPSGDDGIDSYRYKYACIAGRRYFAIGFPDRDFGHYSVAYNYDVMPAQNRFPAKRDATGIVDLGDESVLIFYKDRTERVNVYGNVNYRIDESFLSVGCSNHDSIVKISDDVVAFMDYTGPQLMIQGQLQPGFGDPLLNWWRDTLTNSHKEACVSGYNRLRKQLWFSLPTYTDATYSNGLVFVFDMQAWYDRKVSAWWILDADKTITAQTLADDMHFLTSNGTQIQDWNNSSQDESVTGTLRLKIMRNPRFTQKINFERVEVDFTDSGSNDLTVKLYIDSAASPTATLTITSTIKEALLEYLGDLAEFEIVTASGTQQTDIKSALFWFQYLRGI